MRSSRGYAWKLKKKILKGVITWSEMGQQTNEAKKVYCERFLSAVFCVRESNTIVLRDRQKDRR